MITLITLTIGLFIGAFIGFIAAAVLAMGKYSDESSSKSFADWLKLGVYLDERHFGLRPSQIFDYIQFSREEGYGRESVIVQ